MTPMIAGISPGYRSTAPDADLLLREMDHRYNNDLQLVVGLLARQGRRAENDTARAVLTDVAERVSILARARMAVAQQRTPDLAAALGRVCEAVQPYAEPRSILISLRVDHSRTGLTIERITTLALVVNELVTNALNHGFQDGVSGRITVTVGRGAGGDIAVTVDDDGSPYPAASARDGVGLGIARRLMASIDGLLIAPTGPTKMFELRIPSLAASVPA